MSETEQMESLWQDWSEAQRAMWQGWTKLMSQGAAGAFSADMARQWQKLMSQGVSDAMPDAEGVTRRTAEQLIATQAAMLKFFEMAAQGWKKMAGAEDWRQALNQYLEEVQSPWAAAASGGEQSLQQLQRQYWEQWQAFSKLWGIMGPDRDPFGDTAGDAYNQTIGRWVDSPNLGLTREFNEKAQQGFDAWVSLQRAQAFYQELVNQMWSDAYQQFMGSLAERQAEGKPIESIRELMLSWTSIAEDVFSRAFRSQEYVQAQATLLNANMTHRLRQRALMELLLKGLDLPTRQEMDDAHRRIYESRKEVKALKKELAQLKAKPQKRSSRKQTG